MAEDFVQEDMRSLEIVHHLGRMGSGVIFRLPSKALSTGERVAGRVKKNKS